MSVLAASKHGAVDDGIAADGDSGAVNITQVVELFTEVTLGAAEKVAQIGEILDGIDCSWHTHRASAHGHHSGAIHIRGLAAAIHVGKDVATFNHHFSIAKHPTCIGIPYRCVTIGSVHLGDVGIVTRAAAIHRAEPGFARGGLVDRRVGFDGYGVERLLVVWIVVPTVASLQDIRCRYISVVGMGCSKIGIRVEKFINSIQGILGKSITRSWIVSCANLTARDGHLGIVHHLAVHTTAVHRTFHPSRVADGNLRVVDGGHQIKQGFVVMNAWSAATGIDSRIICGITRVAFTTAEHMTSVIVVFKVVIAITLSNFVTHLRHFGTDNATFHGNCSLAVGNQFDVANRSIDYSPAETTHIGHLTATEH